MCLGVCVGVALWVSVSVLVCLARESGLGLKRIFLPPLLTCYMPRRLFNRFDYLTSMLMSLLDYTSVPTGSDSFVCSTN